MKNTSFLLLSFLILVFSCKDKDAACVLTNANTVIVGDWDETNIGDIGDEVTFRSDNTGTCSEESLFYFDSSISGTSTDFTWSISNSVLVINRLVGGSSEYSLTLTSCDEIGISFTDQNGQPLAIRILRK